jgi:hypothetical protein
MKKYNNYTDEAIMLQTCIREALGLSFGYGTGYTDCFRCFTQLYTIIF